jgi:uncharacterized RDD family membrane protein YckC
MNVSMSTAGQSRGPIGGRFVTPEAVALQADLAGIGSRFAAALVDGVVQSIVLFAVTVSALQVEGDAGLIILVISSFAMLFLYPMVLEGATSGKTIGKAALRIRIVKADGSPISATAVVIRNLFRIVDILPGAYAIGLLTMLITPRAQRLGDLAAGTVAVYDAPAPAPRQLDLADAAPSEAARGMDAGGLTSVDYEVIRSFLVRRGELEPAARRRLAEGLASRVRARVTTPAEMPDEAVLEAAARAYRERFAQP